MYRSYSPASTQHRHHGVGRCRDVPEHAPFLRRAAGEVGELDQDLAADDRVFVAVGVGTSAVDRTPLAGADRRIAAHDHERDRDLQRSTPRFRQTEASPHWSQLRIVRVTDAPAVPDQGVAEEDPLVAREETHQVLLDRLRLDLVGEAEAPGHALDVGVDHEPRRDAVGGAEHDVRGLARDAGQRDQLLEIARHLAAEPLDQALAHPDQALGLVAEEAGRVDLLGQRLRVGAGVVLRAMRYLLEQRRASPG